MHRRRFLTLAGAAVATAGCTGGPASSPTESDSPTTDPDPGASPTETDSPTGTNSPTETNSPTDGSPSDRRLSVSEPAVQPGVVALTTPDSIGIYADAGQYLLVHVDVVEGEAPAGNEFDFRFDGDAVAPGEYSWGLWQDGEFGVGYEAEEGSGWFAFELPETGDAAGARLRWPGGEWTPPAGIRERLAAPLPTFDVEFSAPDSVARGETPTLSLSVTNTSDVAGKCVLAMNRVGPNVAYTPVRDVVWDVEPGETRTQEWAGEPPTAEREVTYHLHGAGSERRSQTIRLADGGDNSSESA